MIHLIPIVIGVAAVGLLTKVLGGGSDSDNSDREYSGDGSSSSPCEHSEHRDWCSTCRDK